MLTRPGLLLHAEALFVLVASVGCFGALHGRWWVFAVFFLAPDVSLLGYAVPNRKRPAAAVYNAVHSWVLPIALGILGWWMGSRAAEAAALIWIAHIAFDRLLGYGLKFPEGFKPTHLQRAGVWGESIRRDA